MGIEYLIVRTVGAKIVKNRLLLRLKIGKFAEKSCGALESGLYLGLITTADAQTDLGDIFKYFVIENIIKWKYVHYQKP